MAEYTREQLRTIRVIKRVGRQMGVPRKYTLAALATAKVEFNFNNRAHGDADSQNWRQERAQGYADEWAKTGGALNRQASVRRFYQEAKALDRGQSAGELAADVQRPREDLRGRYSEEMDVAKSLIGGKVGSAKVKGGYGLGTPGRLDKGSPPKLNPGGTTTDQSGAMLAALLDSDKSTSLLDRYRQQVSSGGFTTTTPASVTPGSKPKYFKGQAPRGGGKGGGKDQPKADVGGVAELFWNGEGARNIKDGQRVGKGFVSGHTDHVHFAADRALMKRAYKLAKSMGLTVLEYGEGITSGHATNSNHYKPFGAMDVSGARMGEFAKRLAAGKY